MSLAAIIKERQEARAALQHLKETIREARPDGISAAEAAEIAEATAEYVGEICDVIKVALESKEQLIAIIKRVLRPA